MRRNRDFMLIICGILIMLVLGLSIAHTTVNAILKVKKDNNSNLNIGYSSSNINMFGFAEINTGAKVSGTNVSNLEVTFQKPGDRIQYLIKFCNNEDSSIVFSNLISNDIVCTDTITGKDDFSFCNKLVLESKVINNDKVLAYKDEILSHSCFDFYISIMYPEDDTYLTNAPIKVSEISYLLDFDKK